MELLREYLRLNNCCLWTHIRALKYITIERAYRFRQLPPYYIHLVQALSGKTPYAFVHPS